MVPAALARTRIEHRLNEDPLRQAAHPDRQVLDALEDGTLGLEAFETITELAPVLRVDTTSGYTPGLEHMLEFINRPTNG